MPDDHKVWFARSELADPTIRIYVPDKDCDDNPPMYGLDAMRYELSAALPRPGSLGLQLELTPALMLASSPSRGTAAAGATATSRAR